MLVLVALLATASPDFDRAIASASRSYQAAEWDAALAQLAIAEAHASGESDRVVVWLYTGCVLANVPDLTGASAAWSKALAIDPDAVPPLKLAPKSLAEFQRLQQAARSIRDATREHASKRANEAPVKAPALTPRVVAAEPAQVAATTAASHGPHPVPIVALGGAVVAGGVAIAMGITSRNSVDSISTFMWAGERAEAHQRAQTQATVANVLFAVTGALGLTALLTFIFL